MTDFENYSQYHFVLHEYTNAHQSFFPHGCPSHYFAKMLTGTATIKTGGDCLALFPGDYFYIPKGLVYRSLWIPDAASVSFYSFGCDSLPLYENCKYNLQKFECGDEAVGIFEKLTSDIRVSFSSLSLLYSFISKVTVNFDEAAYSGSSSALNAALEYMNRSERYSVGDVAEHCSLSESGLYYLFRTHLGKTPVSVKNEILVGRAIGLLRGTDLPIEEIAEKLSFASSTYFRSVLHKYTGKTPSQIRNEVQL